MTATLRIDLKQGTVEVEGSETLVRDVYQDFKSRFDSVPVETTSSVTQQTSNASHAIPSTKDGGGAGSKKKRSSSGKTIPNIVKTLDLSGGGKNRLRDFYNLYVPKTNYERNLIFVYYMTHKLGLSGVTVDHVFTCYRDIPDIKAPNALQQSLRDTSSDKGWLDTSDGEDVKVTMPGINYLEHDMEKAKADA